MATKLNHIQQHLFAGLKKINVTEFQKTLLDVYEIEITEREIQNYINVFKDECNIKDSKELSEYIIINEICSAMDNCKIDKLNDYSRELKLMYQAKLREVETLDLSLKKLKKEHQEAQKLSEDRLHELTDIKEEFANCKECFANKEVHHQLAIDAYKKRIDKYRNRIFFSLISIVILIGSLIVLLFNM